MNTKNYTHNSFGCFDTSSALLRGSSLFHPTVNNLEVVHNLIDEEIAKIVGGTITRTADKIEEDINLKWLVLNI